MHAPLYDLVMAASWLVFLIVWGVGAFTKKPDAEGRSGAFFLWRFILIFLLLYLGGRGSRLHFFNTLLFQPTPALGWIGAALSVVGIGIAIWARIYLGRNWSGFPTHKKEHELVTDGPYEYVRHPIYTGMLLALFGTLFLGYAYSVVIVVVVSVMFIARIGKEERIMLGLFPDAYPPYQKRTKKLLPFIW